jgi:hypothetical protein
MAELNEAIYGRIERSHLWPNNAKKAIYGRPPDVANAVLPFNL